MIKVLFKTKEFENAFLKASSVIPTNPVVPQLGCVKLTIGKSGTAELMGSNTEMNMVATLPAVGDAGVVLLQAEGLRKLVSLLAGESVVLDIGDDKCKLSSAKFRDDIPTINPESFPKLETMPPVKATVNLSALKGILAKVTFAVPQKEGKYAVPVVLVESSATRLRAAATDGSRVAVADAASQAGEFKILIPETALAVIKELPGEVVEFAENETNNFFKAGNVLFVFRKSHAIFPDYMRVVNTVGFVTRAVVEAAGLKLSVDRVITHIDPKKPRMFFVVGTGVDDLQVYTGEDSVRGSAYDYAAAKNEGPANKTELNPIFINEFLANAEKDVTIELIDGKKLVRFTNGPEYTYYIMPIFETAPPQTKA